jgi:hypothetical protein
MARAWRTVVLVAALGVTLAGCGERVEPLPRSTLSPETPPVTELQLLDALPKPADFGPGWTFDVESVGDEDFYENYLQGVYPSHCDWADPDQAEIDTARSAQTVSASLLSPDSHSVRVIVAVDSPAKAADRFAFLRRAHDRCSSIEYKQEGHEITRELEVLPDPEATADESMAASFRDEGGLLDYHGKSAYARAGGVVICIDGEDFPDTALAATLARARDVLSL